MTSMYMSKHGEWCEDEGDLQGFSSRQSLSSSSPQGGGPKKLKFGVLEQPAPKMTPRSHMESISDVLYMDGKIISRRFQWNRFQAQIHL